MASFQGDAAAWEAHLAEGNAKQARKRVAADVLVRDTSQRILLVDPSYKPDWDLPGGMAEANEPPLEAAQREVREELGLTLRVGRLLCVEWVSPHGPWDDTLMFLFDGGTLTAAESNSLRLLDEELVAYRFCTEEQAAQLLRPHVWRRTQAALQALRIGQVCYLQDGQPVGVPAEQSSQ
jgi:8-oxo-dGTP pyrophosphatase MutT (NUDIX family)